MLRLKPGLPLRPILRLVALLIAALWLVPGSRPVEGQSNLIANHAYSRDQVFKVMGRLNAENGSPQENSSVVVHQGYVVEVYSQENSRPQAGISVYNFNDPSSPRLVSQTVENTESIGEQHAIGFAHQNGRDYAALLALDGIEIWDWTDMTAPKQVSHLVLPGIRFGYSNGAWWSAWQAPILYIGGASNGIYIIDTTDPTHPFLVDRDGRPNPIPTGQTGGFRVGPVFAVGNLLVASANDGRGYATFDISDPTDPVLLDSMVRDGPPSYSSMLNGGVLYAIGTDDDLHGLDVHDPSDIRRLDSVAVYGRGGYLTVQDNYVHAGASDHYVKVDISDPGEYRIVGTATSGIPNHDEDFAVVLGNLVVLSDDHYNGSFIFPHQAEPDTTGPSVNMVSPQDGAVTSHVPRGSASPSPTASICARSTRTPLSCVPWTANRWMASIAARPGSSTSHPPRPWTATPRTKSSSLRAASATWSATRSRRPLTPPSPRAALAERASGATSISPRPSS